MITFTIPTLNSSRTVGATIASVQSQALGEDREIIVADGGSVDNTVELAESNGAAVIRDAGRLLAARRRGLERAQGHVIVLLDSDQILRPDSIGAACRLLTNGYDMVVLGERVFQPHTLAEVLSDLDKQLLTHDIAAQLDPQTGVFLPRVFRRTLLAEAFSHIPEPLDCVVIAHDHAIIYYECSKLSTRVAYLPDAIWHVEPPRLRGLWRKNFRYGWSSRQLARTRYYGELVGRKTRPRVIQGNVDARLRLASLAFLGLKGMAYAAGYAVGGRLHASS